MFNQESSASFKNHHSQSLKKYFLAVTIGFLLSPAISFGQSIVVDFSDPANYSNYVPGQYGQFIGTYIGPYSYIYGGPIRVTATAYYCYPIETWPGGTRCSGTQGAFASDIFLNSTSTATHASLQVVVADAYNDYGGDFNISAACSGPSCISPCTISGAAKTNKGPNAFEVGASGGNVIVDCPAPIRSISYSRVNNNNYVFVKTLTLGAANSNLNLSVAQDGTAFSASPSVPTLDGKFSVKPNVPTTVFVNVSGSGFNAPETRTANLSLKIGNNSPITVSVSVAAIQAAGTLQVPFTYTFTAEEVGKIDLSATISSSDDSDSANNTASSNTYVLCDIEDKGTVVPFYSQAQSPWASDPFGNVANSKNPGTIQKYGCSLTDFAMLMESYGIKRTPLGSPLNPAINGVSTINGLKGEVLNPRTLNWAFTNYKTKFTGKASVALNKANDPIWEGMAEVARAGYRAQCSNPANNCNPNNSASAISLKSVMLSGFDNSENSADQKKVMKELCQGNPVILKFKSKSANGQHYMLARSIGVDSSGKIIYHLNNPGDPSGADKLQNDPLLKSNYPYIMGYSIYRPSADPSMMGITAPMNVHFVVTDPLGRRTGFDPNTNTSYSEIPGASYGDQSINTPEDPGYVFETMVAERYFINTSDAPAGAYQIKTYAIQSGAYYLDIRTTDTNGFVNDNNYKTGILATGQSEVTGINHSQDSVPTVNASLEISNYVLNQKDRGLFDVGIIFGGKIKPFKSNTSIALNNSFKLVIGGVNGYKLTIPASQFKTAKILKTKIYTYLAKDIKIILSDSGEFEILIDKSNLQNVTADKAGYLRIDVDSVFADAIIGLKCNKNICTKSGK